MKKHFILKLYVETVCEKGIKRHEIACELLINFVLFVNWRQGNKELLLWFSESDFELNFQEKCDIYHEKEFKSHSGDELCEILHNFFNFYTHRGRFKQKNIENLTVDSSCHL